MNGISTTLVDDPRYIRTPTLSLFNEVVDYFKLDLTQHHWNAHQSKSLVFYKNIRYSGARYKGQVSATALEDDIEVDFKALLWNDLQKKLKQK